MDAPKPAPSPLEVAARDLASKVDLYLSQGCSRSILYIANEKLKKLFNEQ